MTSLLSTHSGMYDKDPAELGHEQKQDFDHDITTGTRRQTHGSIGGGGTSSNNTNTTRIKHLKKDDGIPLWRKDIQHDFLKLVFDDQMPVFTRYSDGARNVVFADIYLDAMARSNRTSKVLKDRMRNDRRAAVGMAMACLLVNIGRMNTTLTFYPEMRAQLRTYHPIPSIQAQQGQNIDKQLQDAPRLKSILKGASEDTLTKSNNNSQPDALEKIKHLPIPRTNPVNLLFILTQSAPQISETHFFPPRDFFDLITTPTLSSKSRARAFLWLMWWYLESDFTRDAALNNPFGAGLDSGEGEKEGLGLGLPVKVPAFEILTEEQADEENIDTQAELEYGRLKRLERKRILEEDNLPAKIVRHSEKDVGNDEDQLSSNSVRDDRISLGRLVSTSLHPSSKDSAEDKTLGQSARAPNNITKKVKRDPSANNAFVKGQQHLILESKMAKIPDTTTVSPAPPGSGHPVLHQFEATMSQPAAATTTNTTTAVGSSSSSSRRPRPLTQHQLAIEHNRRQRVEYIISKRKSDLHAVLREKRENDTAFDRYARLMQILPESYDTSKTTTEEEDYPWKKGGLFWNPVEEEDYGECAGYYLSVVRKAARRLDRWDYECANGPKRDRKKEREERAKRKELNASAAAAAATAGNDTNVNVNVDGNANTNDIAGDTGGSRATTSSRSKGKAPPRSSAKRKSAPSGDSAEAPPNKKQAASTTSRSKSSRARDRARARKEAAATATSTADAADLAAKGTREEAPSRGQIHGGTEMDVDGDDALDDLDKELLGEVTGDEAEENGHNSRRRHRRRLRPSSPSSRPQPQSRGTRPGPGSAAAAAPAALTDEPTFDDSVLVDDDNEPLSSENEEELGSDLDMEEGLWGNGTAGGGGAKGGRGGGKSDFAAAASSSTSSPAPPDIETEVGPEAEVEAEALADNDLM